MEGDVGTKTGNGIGVSLAEGGGVGTRWLPLLVGEGCSSEEEHSLSVSIESFPLFFPPDGFLLAGEALKLRGGDVLTESVSVLKMSSSRSSESEGDRRRDHRKKKGGLGLACEA